MNTQIKAEELRIGNYLDRNGLMQVTAIHKSKIKIYDHFNKMQHEYFFMADTFNGLPITEELLLKAGFEDPGKRIHGLNGKGYLTLMVGTHCIFIFNNGAWELNANVGGEAVPFPCPQLKYFHQLQNLYFALTGKELTL